MTSPHRTPDQEARPRALNRGLEVALATGIAFTLAVRSPIASWLSVGAAVAIIFLPVLLRSPLVRRIAIVAGIIAVALAISGILLAEMALTNDASRYLTPNIQLLQIGQIAGIATSSVAGVWVLLTLGPAHTIAFWSIGATANVFLYSERFLDDPWKYGLALPITILAFLVARGRKRDVLPVSVAVVTIAGISIASSYRSWLLVLAGLLVAAWALNLRYGRERRLYPVGFAATLAVIAMLLAGTFLLSMVQSGALGQSLADRTEQQATVAGNVILGGRPEWAAALAMFADYPWGYGAGIGPSTHDYITGVQSLAVTPEARASSGIAGYFSNGIIEFHSVVWNVWSHFGILGIAVVLGLAIYMLTALSVLRSPIRLSVRFALAVPLIAVQWDLFFSPTVVSSIALALAIAAYVKHTNQDAP